ncbi:MAG: hypothetical protein AAFY91_14095, partial [Bacteroidota bacterium]
MYLDKILIVLVFLSTSCKNHQTGSVESFNRSIEKIIQVIVEDQLTVPIEFSDLHEGPFSLEDCRQRRSILGQSLERFGFNKEEL